MNFDEFLALKIYASEAEADIAASRLRFEGIEAHIRKDDCGGAYPSLQMCRGVKLLVKSEDLEKAREILDEMEKPESRSVEPDLNLENGKSANSNWIFEDGAVTEDPPSQQLEDLKSAIFTYVLIAPLLAALFADKIDSAFMVCMLFVGLVGTACVYFRNRFKQLTETLKKQEQRLLDLENIYEGRVK